MHFEWSIIGYDVCLQISCKSFTAKINSLQLKFLSPANLLTQSPTHTGLSHLAHFCFSLSRTHSAGRVCVFVFYYLSHTKQLVSFLDCFFYPEKIYPENGDHTRRSSVFLLGFRLLYSLAFWWQREAQLCKRCARKTRSHEANLFFFPAFTLPTIQTESMLMTELSSIFFAPLLFFSNYGF